MVAHVIIAIPRHNNYHHQRAVAEGTSHCRTPACEGRPPVLGMVARCKALTQSSLTTLSLPLHVAQHHSRGTARDEVLTLPSSLSHALMRGPQVFLAPCIAWKVSILYPKKDVSRPHGVPQAGHLRRPILQFNSPKQVQARLPDQCWALAR